MICKKKSWTNETRDYSPNISPTDYPSEKNLFQQFLLKFDVSIEWRLLFHPNDSLHDIDQFTQTVTTFLRRAECKNWYFQFRHCPYISITKLRATKKIFGNLYFSINLFSHLSILQERIREDELKRRRKAWKVGIFVPSPLESSIEN